MSTKRLAYYFGTTHWVIQKQLDGITHDESVLQLPFRGNCLNWVLGHILESRQEVLELLGRAPIMTGAERAWYGFGSEPVTNGEQCVRLERLLEILEESQQQILASLEAMSDDDLQVIVDAEKQQTLEERLSFLQFHETYHTGQLEPLRQLAGKNDSVI
ncbi:MAG: DinB family protein [Chloroflexi bacterium AL-W]|nr:DinB family protein [Chloroflexi bacterium AL-N1]NOK70793.1 DinB family protein [Chloroflexi bacterium AL-N10]NOK78353.1 DinB family protein [Chloroflexi bacterium AL-N5]NOK85334.1 DinB family protein [Chloroflexi bacterium AL-W]NOK92610.1 DinB family protein [Chloroflexi bacterium AL-N15]